MINQRIKETQQLLKDNNIDAYIIPTADYHQSEYVHPHFQARAFLSGFTGSAGTFVISQTDACLWVDGRYYIQGEVQTKDTMIQLMKIGLPGVITVHNYLEQFKDGVIGFDTRLLSSKMINSLDAKKVHFDVLDLLWKERQPLSNEKGFLYDIVYCGQERTAKIHQIREDLGDFDYHILTSLDDIAWIFNIRGKDIACNPTLLAYAIIGKKESYLYVQEDTLSKEDIAILESQAILVKDYFSIYEDVKELEGSVVFDSSVVNYAITSNLSSNVTIVDRENPSQHNKAIKNNIEIENTKNAHVKDGVAVTKFMYWLKNEMLETDELEVAKLMKQQRENQALFYDLSFESICGYQENGALMHYQATKEAFSKIKKEGLLLIDSGGQYLDGTTDITRTFAVGAITEEQKTDYTMVLKALLRLSNAKFPLGTTGQQLDILARGVIYDYGLDYRCGTGHGVGHFLGVHEGPNSIRPRGLVNTVFCPIEPGMITTNEPGIYKEGKHGIRLENELLCKKDFENEYGIFCSFETITYCPFDNDAIDFNLLNSDELKQLNDYHQLVFTTLKDHLDSKEILWLQQFLQL